MTCQAKTKSGDPCRAAAGEGGLCYFHANPDSVKRLGQLGGRKNGRSAAVDIQVPEDMTLTDLSKLNVQAMRLLLSGELQAREAAAFAQLSNSQLRIMQGAALEIRVETLEKELAREQAKASADADAISQAAEVAGSSVDDTAETGRIASPAVEPTNGTNTDAAAQPEYLNPTDANAPTCADDEERGEAEQ